MKGSKMTTAAAVAAVALAAGAAIPAAGSGAMYTPACKPCNIGQTLSFKGTAYRVLKVKQSRAIGSSFLRKTTAGTFVIITVRMTNLKNRPSTILTSNVRMRARSGATYDVTSKAFAVYDNGFNLLLNLQPRLPETVVAVYELPRNAVRGAVLQIQDSGSGQKAIYRLGL